MPVRWTNNSREKIPPCHVWLEIQGVAHFDEQNNLSFTKVEMNLLNFSRTSRNPLLVARRLGLALMGFETLQSQCVQN